MMLFLAFIDFVVSTRLTPIMSSRAMGMYACIHSSQTRVTEESYRGCIARTRKARSTTVPCLYLYQHVGKMADPTRSDGEQQLPFYQVDVFSSHAYRGNPVAVTIVDRQNRHRITDEHMTRFARWTNLSETTFIFPGDEQADYSLRIFTPGGELPFAGHPTLGSCRAWLTHGGRPKRDRVIVQRCGVGLVQIKVSEDGRLLSFIAPPLLKSGTPDGETVAQLCKAMDVPVSDVVEAQWVANGPNSIALRLKDAQSVLAVKMADPLAAGDHEWGIVGPYGQGEGPDGATYEVRFFAPNHNIPVRSEWRTVYPSRQRKTLTHRLTSITLPTSNRKTRPPAVSRTYALDPCFSTPHSTYRTLIAVLALLSG